jgi:hypothetical protein
MTCLLSGSRSANKSWNASTKDEDELHIAEGELYVVVDHRMKFGDELKRAREVLGALPDVGHSEAGKAVAKQIKALQSADVERVCKAHKVVPTKVRNHLNNKTVHQLLYRYVNLRLIKRIQDEKDQIVSNRVDLDAAGKDSLR